VETRRCNGKILTSVQGRACGIHQLDISHGEPLEVIGNDHPRYMTALDRIRLIDAAKRVMRKRYSLSHSSKQVALGEAKA